MANPYVTRETIENEVKKALAATLRQDESKVGLDQSVMNDLGATSIDFLDINFRLENAFGIQLATQLLLDHVEEALGEGVAIDKNGQITDGAARLLTIYLGERPTLKAGLYADEVPSFVTPDVLVQSVEGITNELPEACPHCEAKSWTAEDGMKVVCGGCGKDAEYPDGDALTQSWIKDVQAEHKLFEV